MENIACKNKKSLFHSQFFVVKQTILSHFRRVSVLRVPDICLLAVFFRQIVFSWLPFRQIFFLAIAFAPGLSCCYCQVQWRRLPF